MGIGVEYYVRVALELLCSVIRMNMVLGWERGSTLYCSPKQSHDSPFVLAHGFGIFNPKTIGQNPVTTAKCWLAEVIPIAFQELSNWVKAVAKAETPKHVQAQPQYEPPTLPKSLDFPLNPISGGF